MSIPPGQASQPQNNPPRSQGQRWRPVLVYAIIAFTAFIYLIQITTQTPDGSDLLINVGAKDNAAILQGQLWRLITPLFLHGSIFHIGANMYSLWILGPILERFYGRRRFLLLYFLSGISGNIASFYFTSVDSIGASTAIFGLAAAQVVFVYRNRAIFGGQSQSILRNLFIVIAINLVISVALPGIDYFGHLGGIVGGLAFAWFAGPVLKKQTMVLDYVGEANQTYSSIEAPPPQYRVLLVDQVGSAQAWLTAAIELACFVLLVVVRMMRPV
jgi:rhomboid protease GluP